MSDLHLCVLGTALLTDSAAPDGVPLLGPGKLLALVTYLALTPRRSAPRGQLIDLLWGNDAPDAGRRNLRQAIYQLRRRLGPEAIGGDEDALALAAPLTTDRDRFLAAVEAGNHVAAVAVYTGPFFPAFAAPGGAGFEQWADLERGRLHAQYLHALDTLCRQQLRGHRWREAIGYARRLRDADPESESGWRLLLESLVSASDWIPARIEADACEAAALELGREPSARLRTVLRAARQAPVAEEPVGGGRLVAELVGREAEFSAILEEWGKARRGRFRRVHLLGVAGIGKSRLLGEVAARITATGGRVIAVRAVQAERHLAWVLAGDLVRGLAATPGASGVASGTASTLLGLDPSLGARFPAARPMNPAGDELARLRTMALAELVAAVAEEGPLALCIDDLHWADLTSVSALAGLASRVSGSAVLMLTTSRTGTDGPAMERPEEMILLRPWSVVQVGELLEGMGTLPLELREGHLAELLHRATGGNPLLVIEALELGLERGWLSRDAEGWSAPDLGGLLEHLLRGSPLAHRLESLAVDERRALNLLAVHGRPLAEEVVNALPPGLVPGAGVALERLEARGLIVRGAGGRELTHELLGEPVRDSLSEGERRAAHEALGRALRATAGADLSRLRAAGGHLLRSGEAVGIREVLRRYVEIRRGSGSRETGAALALEFLGADVGEGERKNLVRSLPLTLRWPAAPRLAAGGLMAVGAAMALAVWLGQPARLLVSQLPRFAAEIEEGQPLTVYVIDRAGRVDEDNDKVVSVSLEDSSGFWLEGRREASVKAGRAVFDSLTVIERPEGTGSGWVRFRLAQNGVPALVTDSLIGGFRAMGLWIDSGVVNGQSIRRSRTSVRVSAGGQVSGRVYLRYTTPPGTHTMLLAVVPTWGNRKEQVFVGQALANGRVDERLAMDLRFLGPTTPGRYRIILAAAMETEARFVASGTNWLRGEPLWFDGNDLADITAGQAEELNRTGRIMWPWLGIDRGRPEAVALRGYNESALQIPRRLPAVVEYRQPKPLLGAVIGIEAE